MAVSLSELIAQKDLLDRQIREAQARAKSDAIDRVRKLMHEHGLTPADISTSSRGSLSKTGSKVAAKYRDPTTGLTWSGRGLKPKWLTAAINSGKSMESFAIASKDQ